MSRRSAGGDQVSRIASRRPGWRDRALRPPARWRIVVEVARRRPASTRRSRRRWPSRKASAATGLVGIPSAASTPANSRVCSATTRRRISADPRPSSRWRQQQVTDGRGRRPAALVLEEGVRLGGVNSSAAGHHRIELRMPLTIDRPLVTRRSPPPALCSARRAGAMLDGFSRCSKAWCAYRAFVRALPSMTGAIRRLSAINGTSPQDQPIPSR